MVVGMRTRPKERVLMLLFDGLFERLSLRRIRALARRSEQGKLLEKRWLPPTHPPLAPCPSLLLAQQRLNAVYPSLTTGAPWQVVLAH